MSRVLIAGVFAAGVVMLPLSSASAEPNPQAEGSATRTVKIVDIAFKPNKVAIRKGSKVSWRFADGLTFHNVHSMGKHRFRSSRDMKKGTYTVRFARAGTYRYQCTLHPLTMKGTVVVR